MAEKKHDALGYRAKIGILVPATNTIVEPEMAAMQPPGARTISSSIKNS